MGHAFAVVSTSDEILKYHKNLYRNPEGRTFLEFGITYLEFTPSWEGKIHS